MYSSFALFSLEKTTSKDIFTMKAASDIETTLKIFEYKKITVSAGDNASVMVNVNNDTGGSIYYGVFYEMLSPSIKSDDITIAKIDWSANATSGSITNGSILPVELIIINNSSSDITLNIGVAGSDSNELGLAEGKTLITETFDTGEEPSGEVGEKTTAVDYSYTGAVQTATLKAGTHKLEVWGAEGGEGSYDYLSAQGGKGGYSYGTLTLTSDTNVFIYVGGQGQHGLKNSTGSPVKGGFNGGGNSGYNGSSNNNNGGASGGGASDIRIGVDSLYSRVIVAGGGGGGGNSWSNSAATGGAGGGLNGIDGSSGGQSGASAGSSNWGSPGGKGSQTSGGVAGSYGSYAGSTGSFGQGGNGYSGTTNSSAGAGGGSGWYGGGPGSQGNSAGSGGGGGGSGYVYTSSTASSYPSGVKLNSSYYLTNASTIAGNTSFTDNSGSTVTGHSGNGYARITSTVKASTIPSIDTSSVTLKPEPVTNLKDIVTCNDNGSGCKIVLVKPSNTSKMKEDVTYKVLYVLEDNSGKRYKYNKEVVLKSGTNAAQLINSLNDNTTGDSGSGVYKVSHSAIASDSSATGSEIKASDDYRYYGASPNNYICLDMEGGSTCPDKHLYRIIGSIYEEKENTNRIKVIKATPLTDGTTSEFSWDYIYGGSYSNIWATITSGNYSNSLTGGSQLMRLLNSGAWWNGLSDNYYNKSLTATTVNFANYKLSDKSKSYINTSRYYLGGYYQYKVFTYNMYSYERGNLRKDAERPLYWEGTVGLMYPSDYGYAAGNSCSTGTNLYSYDNNCYKKDWLYTNNSQWFISPNSSDGVFALYSSGYVSYDNPNLSFGVYPVFYLTSSTLITGGTGTESDPYLISK